MSSTSAIWFATARMTASAVDARRDHWVCRESRNGLSTTSGMMSRTQSPTTE